MPFLTSTGPPPIAFVTDAQSDGRIKRTVTDWSLGASVSNGDADPEPALTAIRIAPSGGIGVPPPVPCAVTGAVRSALGAAAGNGSSTTSVEFPTNGVDPPQAGVNNTTCPAFGTWLRPFNGRRWPEPFHVPTNATRFTCIVPAASNPIDDRVDSAPCANVPFWRTMPDG